jgi:hypothetical protein
MNKDTVIGIGVGLVIGWLLWRRSRLAAAMTGAGAGAGALFGGSGAAGGCGCHSTRPCASAFYAPLGNYQQATGPVTPPGF